MCVCKEHYGAERNLIPLPRTRYKPDSETQLDMWGQMRDILT